MYKRALGDFFLHRASSQITMVRSKTGCSSLKKVCLSRQIYEGPLLTFAWFPLLSLPAMPSFLSSVGEVNELRLRL